MTEFKVGDRVKCIDNINAESILSLNKIYTVYEIHNNKFLFVLPYDPMMDGFQLDLKK